MATKKMKDAQRATELSLLASVLCTEISLEKKPTEIINVVRSRLAKMLAFLTTKTVDELEIAQLWILFEGELSRMQGNEDATFQPALVYQTEVKPDAEKQPTNNPRKKK